MQSFPGASVAEWDRQRALASRVKADWCFREAASAGAPLALLCLLALQESDP